MINIELIVFNNEMSLEERVLYSYLMVQKEMEERSVEYGYKSIEEVTDDNMYFTKHPNEELEKLLGCSKKKLIMVKKKLEERGLLKQKRTLDSCNKYFVKWSEEEWKT